MVGPTGEENKTGKQGAAEGKLVMVGDSCRERPKKKKCARDFFMLEPKGGTTGIKPICSKDPTSLLQFIDTNS